jgi:hypothetical protein
MVSDMNNAAHEFKSCLEPEPRRLMDPEEAWGQLLRVHEKEGFVLAFFEWGVIILPDELKERLRELEGKHVAILRLDGYYLRIVDA